MELFFKNLDKEIQHAVRNDYKKILKQVSKENIYSIALVTDSDCITLYLVVNTNEYMKKRDARTIELIKDDLPQEQIEKMKAGLICISKWIPDEWGYSVGKESDLDKVSEMLYRKEESLKSEDDVKSQYQEMVLETITSAFQQLIQSDYFETESETVTYFVSMSDDERTPDVENYSAKLLNSEKIYAEFLKRKEGWI